MNPFADRFIGDATANGLQEEDTPTIQQACLFHIQKKCVAVLATSKDLQVWDVDTQQKLYCWDPCPESDRNSPASLCRGLALLQVEDGSLLCVGSDAGIIHTFETSNMSRIQHNYDITHHYAPIAALTSEQASTTCMLASSDDHGALTVFQAKSLCNFRVVHSWEGHGVPSVSIAIKGSTLIGAFYDGSVRLHSLVILSGLSKHSVPLLCCFLHKWQVAAALHNVCLAFLHLCVHFIVNQ